MREDVLVVIPARGGSKGLPGKNIKELAGKPLIHYSIEIARELFPDESICVSTDNEQIKKVAEKTGLKVPFLRPTTLATDTASTQDVIIHAVDFYEKNAGRKFSKIALLQPTSPFRSAKHIEEALAMYDPEVDMVVSVKETKANPYFNLFESTEKSWIVKSKKAPFTSRQDCPKVYELNGSVYIINPTILHTKKMSDFDKLKAYVMDTKYSIDIDNELDWKLAELIISSGLV